MSSKSALDRIPFAKQWQVFRLARNGHSAKSIAETIGVHPCAVVELLKEKAPRANAQRCVSLHCRGGESLPSHRCSGCGAKIVTDYCLACYLERERYSV